MRIGIWEAGGIPLELLVMTDVSRSLRDEERQAWQRLIRVIGHEINNSLAPIKSIAGSLSSLLRNPKRAPDWEDDMRGGLGYVVLDADRRGRKRYDALLRDHSKPALYTAAIDAACMQRWLYGPFPVHTITSGDTLHMQLPLQGQCSWFATPCVQYNGPLPP